MEATKIENPSPFSWEQLAACCTREAAMRRSVYPSRVEHKKMSQDAAMQEIEKMDAAADHFRALAQLPPVRYATAAQKEDIARLCNHPLITRQEKNKVLLGMGRLTEEQATRLIAKMHNSIEDRENTSQLAA